MWIDYFHDRQNPAIDLLICILDAQEPFAITGVVSQGLLQDAADAREWKLLEGYFGTQRFGFSIP